MRHQVGSLYMKRERFKELFHSFQASHSAGFPCQAQTITYLSGYQISSISRVCLYFGRR
jgi:hypothetical protein